jgi:hypothetical protein
MSSPSARFRTWLGSAEFAVTATAIVVALAAGNVAFTMSGQSADGYFVILLAGIAAPSIYENQWPFDYDSRVVAVAWALGACAALLACYALVSTALAAVLNGILPSAAAFATTWLLGIMVAQLPNSD